MTRRDFESEAKAFGWPTFPITIERQPDGKLTKRPLTRHGHKDASLDPGIFGSLWSHANGFGIPMGEVAHGVGLYAIDLDFHRGGREPMQDWLIEHHVPMVTRTHITPSGGVHLLYQLPGKHVRLPSRANIVTGLDTRGQGGWIAYGEGYSSEGEDYLALFPSGACEAVLAGYSGGEALQGGDVVLADYREPESEEAASKLQRRVERMLRGNLTLTLRFRGSKARGDQSRSARDHSVAFLMAKHGLDESQIAWVLLNVFEYGACRDPATPVHTRLRAAMRCAAKAHAEHVREKNALTGVRRGDSELLLASLKSAMPPGEPDGMAETDFPITPVKGA